MLPELQPQVQPQAFRPVRRPVKQWIDPMWHREWLKGTAGAIMATGFLGLLCPTVILPASVGKPVEVTGMAMLSVAVFLAQIFAGLAVIAEWPLNKKWYQAILGGAVAGGAIFGLGDITNVLFYGAGGGIALFVRVISEISLIVTLVALTQIPKIPLD